MQIPRWLVHNGLSTLCNQDINLRLFYLITRLSVLIKYLTRISVYLFYPLMRRYRKTWIGLKNLKNPTHTPRETPSEAVFFNLSFSWALLRYLSKALIENRRAVPGTPTPPPYVHF